MERIDLSRNTRLLVLTGAGISAASGLATFRGSGGLWADRRVEDVATPEAFARDPALVWRFYSERRADAAAAAPNKAHLALAALEQRMGRQMLLVTQNIDGLHQRAGSRQVVELHGSLWRTRCSKCSRAPFADASYPVLEPPICTRCTIAEPRYLRPDIVWFGEPLDPANDWFISEFVREGLTAGDRLVFIAVGTSGAVYPAANLVRKLSDFGAQTHLVNLEDADNASAFGRFHRGPAETLLPTLLGVD